MPKQLKLTLVGDRLTKNMAVFKDPAGKETIVPIYIGQEALRDAFGYVPKGITLTVEESSE